MLCVFVVNEWRSLWQMDMRYSDVRVDDLIRDMADMNVDVKLRAIVTCARAAEFTCPGRSFLLASYRVFEL